MNYKLANLHKNTVNTKFNLSLGYNVSKKITVSLSSSIPLIRAPSGDRWVQVGCTFR